jgi:type VI secretion system Hcp family effector
MAANHPIRVRTLRPSSLSRTLALATPAVSLLVQRADAAFDTFIKFADIKGESLDKTHFEWSTATGFDFGVTVPFYLEAGTGPNVGSPQAKPIVIRKAIDKASPQLFLKSVTGQPLPTVTLELTRVTSSGIPVVFYKMVLTNVFITKIETDAQSGISSTVPTESIELNFEAMSIIYSVTDSKGGVTPQPEVTWNFAGNQK